MFLANFIFVVLHLKIHPAIHLNTSTCVKKYEMIVEHLDLQIEQTRILI